MKVNNINGTSKSTCKCGSWLDHWKNYSCQSLPTYCPEKTCHNKPEVGAHVQKDNSIDRSWYIVPLCTTHNAQTRGSLELRDSIKLASANVAATCGAS
jgi:hypothetical protein